MEHPAAPPDRIKDKKPPTGQDDRVLYSRDQMIAWMRSKPEGYKITGWGGLTLPPGDKFTLISGPTKTGKSGMLQSLLEGAARAESSSLVIASEAPAQWIERLVNGWPEELDNRMPAVLVEPLTRPEQIDYLCEWVDGNPRQIIAVDTLARMLTNFGLDENSAEVDKVIHRLQPLVGDSRALVVVHHYGKEHHRGSRGSSAIESSAGIVYEAGTTKDDQPQLTYKLSNFNPRSMPQQITFEWQPTGRCELTDWSDKKSTVLTDNQHKVLTGIDRLTRQNPSGGSADDLEPETGLTAKTIRRAAAVLETAGKIHVVRQPAGKSGRMTTMYRIRKDLDI